MTLRVALELSSWMKLAMDRLQAILVNVSVVLSRGDAGVAKHFLNRAEVSPSRKQMGRKTVPETMWTDFAR